MIALVIALLVQDASLLGAIPRQALPTKGCAAYLWDNAPTRRLVAMAAADPATLRFSLDGKLVDLARAGQQGVAGFGFAGVTEYRSAEVTAILDLTVETRPDLSGGAVVPAATLRVERPGRDVVVTPVAGLIGCV
jgi:hypothetical protein